MGSWLNNDGLYIQYGTQKAVAETAGEYISLADGNRVVEILLDLTTLNTSTPSILSNTQVFGTGNFIESVELVVETAAVGSTATLSVGMIQTDRSTVLSNTGFVNALAVTSLSTAGAKVTLVGGSTGAGGYIGQVANPASPGYITALAGTAVFTAGKVRIRIKYHNNTTITQ